MGIYRSPYKGYAARSSWKDGYQAFLQGRAKSWCPIAKHVDGYYDWMAGWNWGEREAEERKKQRETCDHIG